MSRSLLGDLPAPYRTNLMDIMLPTHLLNSENNPIGGNFGWSLICPSSGSISQPNDGGLQHKEVILVGPLTFLVATNLVSILSEFYPLPRNLVQTTLFFPLPHYLK